MSLPATSKALMCTAPGELRVEEVPTPQATHGSVIIKVIHATAEQSMFHLINGKLPGLSLPFPFVPTNGAIGRIAAIGPDTTSLEIGQLVFLDAFIRGRDNHDVEIISGAGVFGGDARAIKLMEDVWRHGAAAEYVRAPLENVFALDEKVLLGNKSDGGLGYELAELCLLRRHLVPYGGLRSIGLEAGQTIVIAPATGALSSAAVELASALGAKVIAMGRNVEKLEELASRVPRVNIVQMTNDPEVDLAATMKLGPVDAYLDLTPPGAGGTTHIRTCFNAVRQYGKVALMGFVFEDVPMMYGMLALKNLTVRGRYMYAREDVLSLIKLAETGVLKLGREAGHEIVGRFGLEQWKEAGELAARTPAAGKMILFDL